MSRSRSSGCRPVCRCSVFRTTAARASGRRPRNPAARPLTVTSSLPAATDGDITLRQHRVVSSLSDRRCRNRRTKPTPRVPCGWRTHLQDQPPGMSLPHQLRERPRLVSDGPPSASPRDFANLLSPPGGVSAGIRRARPRRVPSVAPQQANTVWEGGCSQAFPPTGLTPCRTDRRPVQQERDRSFRAISGRPLSRPPAHVPAGKRRRTKESEGGLFAAFAAFWGTQMLDFQPVSQLLPEYEHTVTALTGLLAAVVTYPLATWWLKRLPCQTHASGRR